MPSRKFLRMDFSQSLQEYSPVASGGGEGPPSSSPLRGEFLTLE